MIILTSLGDDPVEVEAWFRERAQVEERLKDGKLGMSLRHLPSGFQATNALWMWACFLALNCSAILSAFAREAAPSHKGEDNDRDEAPSEEDPPPAPSPEVPPNPTPGPGAPARVHLGPLWAHGKRLRREIVNVPGLIAHHARGLIVHLHPSQDGGPLIAVHNALATLPPYGAP